MITSPTSTTLNVALAQIDCILGDVAENARRARDAISRARDAGANLVVFPELSLTGYALGTVMIMPLALGLVRATPAAVSAGAYGPAQPRSATNREAQA